MGEEYNDKQSQDMYQSASWLQEAIHVLTGC